MSRSCLLFVLAAICLAQTQVDLSRQVRSLLPFTSGGTNAATQAGARANVGTTSVVATDFPGADIAQKVANAFASFGPGKCGVVEIPAGSYTYSSGPIFVPYGCTLRGAGFGRPNVLGTRLVYSGPPATSAVVIMNPDYTDSYYATVENLYITDGNSTVCPNAGMLAWNPAATGGNKWQCYDGTSYSAPTVHLAGVQHGQINPTVLDDGAHITIRNVSVDGDAQEVFPNQGGFHFGFYLNGCEECLIEKTVVEQADDGYYVGEAANGVLFNQITARINRRSGFHYRGANHFLCNECLLEANQWWGQPADPSKYGAGVRVSSEHASTGAGRGGKFLKTYFEANWVDLMAPAGDSGAVDEIDGFQSIRGALSGKWMNCTIPDASLVTVGNVVNGCGISSGAFNAAGPGAIIATTDPSGTYLRKIETLAGSGLRLASYELIDGQDGGLGPRLILRTDGPFSSTEGLALANSRTATSSVTAMPSAGLYLHGSRWTGSAAQEFQWRIRAASATPPDEDGIAFDDIAKGLYGTLVVATGSTYATARFKAAPGQTANLTEWRTSSEGVLAAVTKDGGVQLGSVPQANLGPAANGTLIYCSDCNQDATCTAGGAGALAKRIAGSWKCN